MNMLSFKGLFVLACVGAASLYFKPWEHQRPPAAGVVAGKALASDGSPVWGANVVLRDDKGIIVGRTESGFAGSFEFDNCRPGRYRVAAAKPGVGGGERNVLVDSGTRADATLPLANGMTAVGHR